MLTFAFNFHNHVKFAEYKEGFDQNKACILHKEIYNEALMVQMQQVSEGLNSLQAVCGYLSVSLESRLVLTHKNQRQIWKNNSDKLYTFSIT